MNEMNYSIQDFCCLCLSTSNEKFSNKSSKCPDNLTPFDKIKAVFLELASVMDSENRICLKCSDTVDSIYKFNKTCLKNIKIFNSYKKSLKDNKLNKKCALFVILNASNQFDENTPTSEEVKIEPPESPLNNVNTLCDTDFILESHSSEAVNVKEEFEMNFESYDGKSETSRLDSEIKKEIEDIDLEGECMDESGETWQDELSKPETKDFKNVKEATHEEEEENMDLLTDPLLDVAEDESVDNQGRCESIGEIQSDHFEAKLIHTGEKPHKCNICGKLFNQKENFKKHMLTHTVDRPYKCNICGKLFIQNKNLMRHMLTHTDVKAHKCDICGKSFIHKDSLTRHIHAHTGEKRHKCKICGKLFSQSGNLIKHMLIHNDDKSHKCEICGKLFIEKSRLTKHMVTHTGEKPYKCDVCEKVFTAKTNLQRHMLIHTGEKPHKCDICSKSFFQKNDLKRHMLIHIDVKPYKCDICGKLFIQNGNLQRHMLIHTDEKPHKCDICEKTFNLKDNLKKHMRTHTGGKPHKCDICGKSFQRQENLILHMLEHTAENLTSNTSTLG